MDSNTERNPPALAASSPENIFLFIPNLVGYSRIILAIASLYYMPIYPRTCSILYSISCLLDALDGLLARKLNQSTRFGAALDMVTDRCTTSCLLVFLASAFPRYGLVFQSLISLDLASHYMHMYATLVMGGSTQSHKEIDGRMPWVMRRYYADTRVLFTVCAGNEVFFIALYLLSFSSPAMIRTSSSGLLDQWSAGAMELTRAGKLDSRFPWILLCASAPLMLFKQWVNGVQLVEASKWIAEGDLAERKKKQS